MPNKNNFQSKLRHLVILEARLIMLFYEATTNFAQNMLMKFLTASHFYLHFLWIILGSLKLFKCCIFIYSYHNKVPHLVTYTSFCIEVIFFFGFILYVLLICNLVLTSHSEERLSNQMNASSRDIYWNTILRGVSCICLLTSV